MIFNTYFVNIFVSALSLLLLIYFYKLLSKNHDYWLARGIRGPWPIPGFGTFIYYILYSRTDLDIIWMKRFGKIYGIYDGNKPSLSVAEPELIKQILVKDFHIFTDRVFNPKTHPLIDSNLFHLNGDEWKRVRTALSPVFTTGKIRKMYPLIRQCVKNLMSGLEMDGKDIDIKKLYEKYTLDVIATCAFATKVDWYHNSSNLFVNNALKSFNINYVGIILNIILPTFILRHFQISISNVGSNRLRKYFFNIIRGIIKERKNSYKCYYDFIELMLNNKKCEQIVEDHNDITESHHMNKGDLELQMESKTFSGVGKYLTENEIIGNAYLFLLGNYESPTSTLSHCTQELALNPEVQEKLYSEIISSIDSNGEIDYHLLTKLPYLDAVISETLRLHSPFLVLERIALKDCKLGDTGINIFKGQSVQIPIHAVHKCEEHYPNANHFIPERFLLKNRDNINPYAYIPFGGGPHNCIALRFALIEIKLVLVHLIQNYIIVKSTNTDIPVLMNRNVIIQSPQRVIVSIVKRK